MIIYLRNCRSDEIYRARGTLRMDSYGATVRSLQGKLDEILEMIKSKSLTEQQRHYFGTIKGHVLQVESILVFGVIETIYTETKLNRVVFLDENALYYDTIITELKKNGDMAILESEHDYGTFYAESNQVQQYRGVLDMTLDWDGGIPDSLVVQICLEHPDMESIDGRRGVLLSHY